MPSGQQQCCNIYLSVVKNSRLFKKSVENYINQEFQEEVKLVSRHVVHLNDTDKDVTVQYIYVQNSATNFFIWMNLTALIWINQLFVRMLMHIPLFWNFD